MQILRDILYMLRLKYSTQEYVKVTLFYSSGKKKVPQHSAVINACCHTENDFKVCKLNRNSFYHCVCVF